VPVDISIYLFLPSLVGIITFGIEGTVKKKSPSHTDIESDGVIFVESVNLR